MPDPNYNNQEYLMTEAIDHTVIPNAKLEIVGPFACESLMRIFISMLR